MVVWTIECDDLPQVKADVKCSTHASMVKMLIERGFTRLLNDDLPYQDEPLVYTDRKGRIWDAQPNRMITHVSSIQHMNNLTNAIINNEAKPKETDK